MSYNNKKDKLNISRRELIQGSAIGGLGLINLNILAEAVFNGIFSKAHAQVNGNFNKKYVFISRYGAPTRWTFDLPLTPDGKKDKFIASEMVGTRYTGGTRYTDVVHDTTFVNGLHMPWMWQFDIAIAGGGMAPMANLMDGMLIVRGQDTRNAAHGSAMTSHYNPNAIPVSLTALTADRSEAPIAGINMGSYFYTFKSGKGLSPTSLTGNNDLIKQLLKPFVEKQLGGYQTDQAKIAAALETSLNSFDKIAKDQHPQTALIKKNMESAIELFNRNFGDVTATYTMLYNKYKDLIDRSINPNRNLPGITDKPIGTTGSRDINYRYAVDRLNNSDLRTMIGPTTNLDEMAGRFAVAEFVLLNDLTSSVSFNARGFRNLVVNGSRVSQSFDEHTRGSMGTLLVNTFYNLGLSACLYEFISQLKANNIYQDTVIDLCAEFARTPQNDGGGSDHSAQANSQTFFSGAIQGSHVIGNIAAKATSRSGTWGYAGNNPGFGKLGMGHFVATLSHLMEIPSQVTAVPSLVKQEGTKFVPALPTGTIVD